MAHEFVGVAQAILVEDAELVEHDRVVHRAAQAEVALAHVLEVAHEAEGAGAADFADVGLGGEVDLGPRQGVGDRRVVEAHGEPDPEPVVRGEAGELVAVAHLDRPPDADEALRRVLLGDAGGLQQEHERAGRAVHDRDFGGGQFDVGVVDAEAGERGQQVLDGLHLGRATAEAGAQGGFADQLGASRDLGHGFEVGAPEHDAVIDRGRAKGQEDLVAAVQAHASGADHGLEGALAQHRRRVARRTLNLNEKTALFHACNGQ